MKIIATKINLKLYEITTKCYELNGVGTLCQSVPEGFGFWRFLNLAYPNQFPMMMDVLANHTHGFSLQTIQTWNSSMNAVKIQIMVSGPPRTFARKTRLLTPSAIIATRHSITLVLLLVGSSQASFNCFPPAGPGKVAASASILVVPSLPEMMFLKRSECLLCK